MRRSRARDWPYEPQILQNVEGGGLWGYYSKGHHDPALLAAHIQYEEDLDVSETEVQHAWGRRLIIAADTPDGWVQTLEYAREGQRGAFPITVWEAKA